MSKYKQMLCTYIQFILLISFPPGTLACTRAIGANAILLQKSQKSLMLKYVQVGLT